MWIHSARSLRCPSMSSQAIDVSTWEAWAREHARLIRSCVLSYGIPPARAQDLCQEVWERLYRRWVSGKLTEVQMPGLALWQARKLALSELRKRGELPVGPAHELELASPFDEEGQFVERAHLLRIINVVRSYSPKDQRIFDLSYGPSEMTAVEVSREVGKSHGHVRKVLSKLRKHIRRLP